MTEEKNPGKIAVIRIRGQVDIRKGIKETLVLLHLNKPNWATVLDATPCNLGMVKKAKDYITYGEIDDATFKLLAEKRGEAYLGREKDSKGKIDYSRKYVVINNKKLKPFFRLMPPKGGFERKGIKKSFKQGGALGDRGDKINELIKRMI